MIFFFNRFLLPFGLQYSILLVPFFVYYLFEQKVITKLKPFLLAVGVYSVIHLCIGVVLKDFMVSLAMLVLLLIVLHTFYHFYKQAPSLDLIFKRLTQLNFGFTLIALIALITNKFVSVFWYLVPFTAGYKVLPRLKLFELEASHYSLSILPLFLYYFWKNLKSRGKNRQELLLFLSLILSLILSFSLGIIATINLAIFFVIIIRFIPFLRDKKIRNTIGIGVLIGLTGVVLLLFVFPNNPLSFRLNNLLNGADTSGRGRTYEAIDIALRVLKHHNAYFGIGLGQFKIVGRDLLIHYYTYLNIPEVVRLPNCIAETLVTYGFVGFFLKIFAQVFLFFKVKVFKNVFQLSIFVAIFIYQFTGSFLFNGMEYFLWIMAFVPKLKEFNQSNYFNH